MNNLEPSRRPEPPPTDEWPMVSATFLAALCEALIGLPPLGSSSERIAAQDLQATAAFTRAQFEALPRALALLQRWGLGLFQLYVLLTRFASFESLPLDQRTALMERWAYGRFSLARALFRAPRISAFMAYYELPSVRRRLACSKPEAEVVEP